MVGRPGDKSVRMYGEGIGYISWRGIGLVAPRGYFIVYSNVVVFVIRKSCIAVYIYH